ncbi:phage tail protein [Pseudomonas sp. EggHat1]|uniref:phage tail protein n=1 Tax=Pseudomonas sp. EggHat1 TaxID=2761624 RepID=UPI001866D3B5|nr:phage tail protein [Pseudomonas sp. EggHat1]
MNKPNSLRDHLLAADTTLAQNPERLLVFIDEGNIRSTAAPGLSFEWLFTLNIMITDYAGHPDNIAIPLLDWLRRNQPDLLTNIEKGKDAIGFEADILGNDKVDLSITLPLTERVIVKRLPDESLEITHPPEQDFGL